MDIPVVNHQLCSTQGERFVQIRGFNHAALPSSEETVAGNLQIEGQAAEGEKVPITFLFLRIHGPELGSQWLPWHCKSFPPQVICSSLWQIIFLSTGIWATYIVPVLCQQIMHCRRCAFSAPGISRIGWLSQVDSTVQILLSIISIRSFMSKYWQGSSLLNCWSRKVLFPSQYCKIVTHPWRSVSFRLSVSI